MNNIKEATNQAPAQTPIEIALGIDENGMTTARALYDFLEMPQKNFARWAKQNIENNEFYEENKDWWGFVIVKNGNECKDYRLTTDFAKHLSMESHSAKGKTARQYFVSVEDKTKDVLLLLKQASGDPMKLLKLHYKALEQVDKKVDYVTDEVQSVKKELQDFKETLPLLPEGADRISDAVKKRGVEILGGKKSPAYNDKGLRMRLYINFYSNLKYNFNVRSYKSIKRNQKAQALQIVAEYKPPLFLAEQIDNANAQQTLNFTEKIIS